MLNTLSVYLTLLIFLCIIYYFLMHFYVMHISSFIFFILFLYGVFALGLLLLVIDFIEGDSWQFPYDHFFGVAVLLLHIALCTRLFYSFQYITVMDYVLYGLFLDIHQVLTLLAGLIFSACHCVGLESDVLSVLAGPLLETEHPFFMFPEE